MKIQIKKSFSFFFFFFVSILEMMDVGDRRVFV